MRNGWQTSLVIVVFFLLWQFLVMLFRVPEVFLPSPLSALNHLLLPQRNANYHWLLHIRTTLGELLISFAVTAAAGVSLAIAIVWSKLLRQTVLPFFVFLNSLPLIAVAPLIMLWFGYGLFTNIFIAFLVSFFPVVINTASGLDEVDEDLLDLVRYLHAPKWQVFLKIRIPNSLPYIFSGLKISSTMCVVGVIVAEFVGSNRGLGYIIINGQATMDTPPIFSSFIMISLLGVGLFGLVGLAERLLMPWQRKRAVDD
jgi:NitT/TauT family transport system permease protein